MDIDKAFEKQLQNIQARSGKTLEELGALLKGSGLTKHGELRDFLKKELGLGHGDANTMVHYAMKSSAQFEEKEGDVLEGIYTGGKAALRPIHEKLMGEIEKLGEFEVAPKKGYVSLRRKKQFAMIGPGTNSRVDIGINMKGVDATDRLVLLPPGGMCQYQVRVTDASQVDDELMGWIRQGFEAAG